MTYNVRIPSSWKMIFMEDDTSTEDNLRWNTPNNGRQKSDLQIFVWLSGWWWWWLSIIISELRIELLFDNIFFLLTLYLMH